MENKNILVVEDDNATRDTMVDLLSEAGYEVESATNGEEAIAMVREYSFDMVITDLKMPKGDGIQVLEEIMLMILQEDTIDEFPDVGTTLDFTEEERIHQRMFSGEWVTDPQGVHVPAMKTIEFLIFNAMDGWSAADDRQ